MGRPKGSKNKSKEIESSDESKPVESGQKIYRFLSPKKAGLTIPIYRPDLATAENKNPKEYVTFMFHIFTTTDAGLGAAMLKRYDEEMTLGQQPPFIPIDQVPQTTPNAQKETISTMNRATMAPLPDVPAAGAEPDKNPFGERFAPAPVSGVPAKE